jgi:hypothetical protein
MKRKFISFPKVTVSFERFLLTALL